MVTKTLDEVLKIINEAKITNAKELNLSKCGLKELPEELFELKNLSKLNLYRNNLTDIGYIKELKNLTTLDLSNNGLKDVSYIKELKNLTYLTLSRNSLTDISFIKGLNNLTILDLSGNYIIDVSYIRELKNLTTLDLSYNKLTDISYIRELKNLTALNLYSNKLTDVSYMNKLKNLTALYLGFNKLTDVSFIKELKNLTALYLSDNYLTDVSSIKELKNLTSLSLSRNILTDVSSIKELKNLTTLHLSSNKLTDVSYIKELKNLTTLNLSRNNLTDANYIKELKNLTTLNLSGNKLTDVSFIRYLSDDIRYEVEDNPIKIPPLNIVQEGVKAIKDYFAELEKQGTDFLYEAKLLIVGEPGAGKTTLMLKLKNENAEMPVKNDTTRGIDIDEYTFNTKENKELKVNMWDFGGQQIYHATHQFFLTQHAVYALVDDTRTEKTDFNYWLSAIESFGEKSPVIIVQNEIGGRKGGLDLKNLQARFENIKELKNVDLLTNAGLKELKDTIEFQIEHLPRMGEPLPKQWVAIRKRLGDICKTEPYISYDKFVEVCKNNLIPEEDRILFLSAILHELGAILHFQNDVSLKNTVFLQNEYVTNAVYKVFDDEIVIKNSGSFFIDEIDRFWGENKYKSKKLEFLSLMQKFELCYKVPYEKSETYIIPQLLQGNRPVYNLDFTNSLKILYKYDFMPKGLFSRFLVRKHYCIYKENNIEIKWKTGVVLTQKNTYAEVIENYDKKEIIINITGSHKNGLVSIIIDEFDRLNYTYNLKVDKMVPCNCEICSNYKSAEKFNFSYNTLQTRLERGKRTIECENSYEDVDITALLDEIFIPVKKGSKFTIQNVKSGLKPTKVFISYSKSDILMKEELIKHLQPSIDCDEIEIWSDNMLELGSEWDEKIRTKLEKSDLVLFLVSSDFIATKYIKEVELKNTLNRYEEDKNSVNICPIILRPCNWEKTVLGKFTAFPFKGEPVTEWLNKDKAYLNIVNSIEKLLITGEKNE
ncbi:MAG: COR domain-containing protein [bacterium]